MIAEEQVPKSPCVMDHDKFRVVKRRHIVFENDVWTFEFNILEELVGVTQTTVEIDEELDVTVVRKNGRMNLDSKGISLLSNFYKNMYYLFTSEYPMEQASGCLRNRPVEDGQA